MFRNLLANRWLQGGVVFFLVCVGGSLLYSWHVGRTTARDMARHARFLQGLEKQDTARPVKSENTNEAPERVETPPEQETQDAETPTLPSDSESVDAMETFEPDGPGSPEKDAKSVGVSPFGFGPFPAVPPDYPKEMIPTWVKNGERMSHDHELMHRVLIKLWTQGDTRVSGAFMGDGLVYPLYPNTAYVEYRDVRMPDGTTRRMIKSANGPLGTTPITKNGFPVLPDGVKAIERKDAGINPYDFLGLK